VCVACVTCVGGDAWPGSWLLLMFTTCCLCPPYCLSCARVCVCMRVCVCIPAVAAAEATAAAYFKSVGDAAFASAVGMDLFCIGNERCAIRVSGAASTVTGGGTVASEAVDDRVYQEMLACVGGREQGDIRRRGGGGATVGGGGAMHGTWRHDAIVGLQIRVAAPLAVRLFVCLYLFVLGRGAGSMVALGVSVSFACVLVVRPGEMRVWMLWRCFVLLLLLLLLLWRVGCAAPFGLAHHCVGDMLCACR